MTVLPGGVMRELVEWCEAPFNEGHLVLDDSFYTRADNVILVYEDGLNERLHRKLWKLVRPEPIDDKVLIRVCEELRCVNPWHYEAKKTSRPPLAPGSAPWQKKRLKFCKNGHPLSGDNLLVHVDRAGYSHRECRLCKVERTRQARRGHAG